MTATLDLTAAPVTPARLSLESPIRPLIDPARFASLVSALRWGSVFVGLALGGTQIHRPTSSIVIWAAVLGLHAWAASMHPWWRTEGFAPIAADLIMATIAVAATGAWASPFIFTLFVVVVEAASTAGAGSAFAVTGLAVGLVTVGDRLVRRPRRTAPRRPMGP